MDKIEELFVLNHIHKDRRERVKLELASRNKRRDFFQKLSKNTSDMLSSDQTWFDVSADDAIRSKTLEYVGRCDKDCYILSWDAQWDRKIMSVDSALDIFFASQMECILIFSEGSALIKVDSQLNRKPVLFIKSKK
jgi:hypothetical protein